MRERRARTFSGVAAASLVVAGCCAWAASGAVTSNSKPSSAMTTDPEADIRQEIPVSGLAKPVSDEPYLTGPIVHCTPARTCRTDG